MNQNTELEKDSKIELNEEITTDINVEDNVETSGKKVKYLSDKKEFIFLDIMKFICSLLVLAIHLPPLVSFNTPYNYWFTYVFARIAVPFFFVCSGYFVYSKMNDKKALFKYIKRLLIFYGIYTILYTPQIIYNNTLNDLTFLEDVGMYLRNTLLIASYSQLWYIIGIICSTLILYVFINKFKFKDVTIIIVSLILFCIGTICNEYPNLITNEFISKVYEIYCAIFRTTRNGLFFGLLLVSIGYLIRKHSHKIKINKTALILPVLIVFGFWLITKEKYDFLPGQSGNKNDMLFTLPIVTTLLFLGCSFIKINVKYEKIGFLFRKLSIMIFGFHLLIKFYVNLYLASKEISLHSFVLFSIVLAINLVIAVAIILLQKKFNKLKYMY